MLFGVENPIVDLKFQAGLDVCLKYNLKYGQAILSSPSHDALFEEALASPTLHIKLGGTVLTTIRTVNKVLQKPNECIFLGCVGDDEDGKLIKETLLNEGIKFSLEITDQA